MTRVLKRQTITRRTLMNDPIVMDKPFEELPQRLQKWIARALRVRAEEPATAWEVWRWLAKHDPATALKYPDKWEDSVPGRGYNGGGNPASRFLWYDIPPVRKMLEAQSLGVFIPPNRQPKGA